MASLGNPRTWIPYMNGKDCSQGICSFYCPQWCYTTYPPPPTFEYPNGHDSSPNFPPLIIAITGILAIVFLLVSYYTIMSKYYYHRENYHDQNDELQDNHHIHNSSLWHVSSSTTTGLDEALIKSIMICKYKKGDHAFVEFSDCSVCLSEFQDAESVRLLPKCGHAFHLPCIDTWLKSHTTCPLCRANIFTFNNSQLRGPSPVVLELIPVNETLSENQHAAENIIVGSETEFGIMKEESTHGSGTSDASNPALRALSDLGSLHENHKIVEIRDDVFKSIRSVSLDHSVADVLHMNNQEQDSQLERCTSEAGPSKRESNSKYSYKRRMLHCVLSPIAMKKSFPSGRFSLKRSDRGSQGSIHV